MLDMLRPYWYPVAPLAELGDGPTRLKLLGEQLVLWKGPEGRPVAMKDLCIHRGAALSGGTIENGEIKCPYHGWKYSASGACTHIPALPPGAPIPAKARAITYPTRAAYGMIWICLGDGSTPFPDFLSDYEDEATWRQVYVDHYDWKTSAGRVVENAMDFSHFNFVHTGYTELADGPVIKPYEVERNERGFTYAYDDGHLLREYVVEFPFIVHDRKRVTNPAGGKTWSDSGEGSSGDVTLLSFFATPLDEGETRIHVMVTRNHSLDRADSEFTGGFGVVMLQDQVIVETQRPEQIPVDVSEELHIRMPDQHAILYRRMLRELNLPAAYMP